MIHPDCMYASLSVVAPLMRQEDIMDEGLNTN